MRGLLGFYFLSRLFGNPFVALVVILVIFFLLDRGFVGLLPDIFKPFRQAGAIRRLRQALSINPADATAQLELGTTLAARGKWHDALPYLEKAAERLNNAHALFQLGMAYVRVGEWEDGEAALKEALSVNPRVGYGEPYIYLAEVQLRRDGRIGEIPGLEETLRQYGSVDVRYELGRLYEEAGDLETARTMYQEALETHRENPHFLRKQQRRTALKAWFRLRFLQR